MTTRDPDRPPADPAAPPDSPAPERPVAPVRVSYTQAWLYFLFVICFLVAWWFPLKLLLNNYSFFKSRAVGARDADTFVSLAYAGVSSLTNEISPQRFREHLQALRRGGYTPIAAEDVLALFREGRPLPRKAVLLTFDQARKTSYFETRAMLRRGGWPAIMFLWTKPVVEQDPANLRWPYIAEIARSRSWAIGAQSDNGFAQVRADAAGRRGNFLTTPMWLPAQKRFETLDEFEARLNQDHLDCLRQIEQHVGRKPRLFAFPYGDFGQYDARAVLIRRVNLDLVARHYDLGFIAGNKALNTRHSDPRRLHRLLVDPAWSADDLLARLDSAWPLDPAAGDWRPIAGPSAWILDWGSLASTNRQLILAAPPAVTGAKAWLAGSDLCDDIAVKLDLQLRGGQLGVYLRASADEESYLLFGMDASGNVWVRQKFVGLEAFTLATGHVAVDPAAVNALELYVRDKICFAAINGQTLFPEQVVVRGAAMPGMIGLSVWDPLRGVARADIHGVAIRSQQPQMVEWTPREVRGPYVPQWVSRNAYRLTHLAPPWLRVTQQGVLQTGAWDPLLYRMLARSYHLELAPSIWIEKEQWMDTLTPSNLAARLEDIQPDAVYLNLADLEHPALGKLTRWLQGAGAELQRRGIRMLVRLPAALERAATLPAMLAVIPNTRLAAAADSPLLAGADRSTNRMVAIESLPMPPADMDLSLYYEITGLDGGAGRLTREARTELLRQEGHVAFQNGDYSRAMAHWTQWSQLDPDSEEPLMLIGDAYLRLYEVDKALDYYARSLAINPGQIDLAIRRIRLIDQTGQPEEAIKLLNLYARVFPNNPDITLAQADWLVRHERPREATDLVRRVLAIHPDHLTALTMMQDLLDAPAERYANMRRLRDVGVSPVQRLRLGDALWYNELTGKREFCVLARFLEQVVRDTDTEPVRALYRRFLPREEPVVEDFSLGKLSAEWMTSSQSPGEEGRLSLRAGPSQAEVYLRLLQSDALRNGFIEADLDDIRGFFWLYARRMRQDMVRLGFDQAGSIYLQVWQKGNLTVNETRPWFKPRGTVKVRLEIRGDGASGFVDGKPIFGAPVAMPRDLGLGWWGMAPYAPRLGTANATLHYLSAGPLPVQVAVLPDRLPEADLLNRLKPFVGSLSALAPSWFRQMPDGRLVADIVNEDVIVRMVARYHRIRLLPLVQMADFDLLSGEDLSRAARAHHVAGFVLQFDQMPPDAWFERLTRQLESDPVNVLAMVVDARKGIVRLREINLGVGLFPMGERTRVLPVVPESLVADHALLDEPLEIANDSIVWLAARRPPAQK